MLHVAASVGSDITTCERQGQAIIGPFVAALSGKYDYPTFFGGLGWKAERNVFFHLKGPIMPQLHDASRTDPGFEPMPFLPASWKPFMVPTWVAQLTAHRSLDDDHKALVPHMGVVLKWL